MMRRALTGFMAAVAAALALVAVAPLPASATSVIAEWNLVTTIGSIVASPDGARLYVATVTSSPAANHVLVVDAATGDVITDYPGPATSATPYALAISPDGSRLYATSHDSNLLVIYNTASGGVINVVNTGSGPTAVAATGDGRLFVSLDGDNAIQIIGPPPFYAVATVSLGGGHAPAGIAVTADGSVAYTANPASGTVSADPFGGPATTIAVGGEPRSIAFSPDGTQVIVGTGSGNQLVAIDTATLTTTAVAMSSATAPLSLAGPSRLYVTRANTGLVDVVGAPALGFMESVGPVTGDQGFIAASPDGSRVYVSSSNGTITVLEGNTAPVITTASPLPDGTVGTGYSTTIAATGIPAPTFSVTDGALPDGLALNGTTGVIAGTPTAVAAGTSSFEITATNTVGTAARSFTITAQSLPVITTASPLPDSTVGTGYSTTIAATGIPSPTYSVTDGVLPDGLALDATTGVISGTPTAAAAGTTSFEVTSGILPAGLALNATTGAITGTPTTVSAASFEITATNPAGTDDVSFSITVNPAPAAMIATGLEVQSPLLAAGALILAGMLVVSLAMLRRRRA